MRPLVVLLWVAIILTSALALWGTRPPGALGDGIAQNTFSAARAIHHLTRIAKEPRPIGSDEAVRVREYLIEQLRTLGGEVRVEPGIGTAHYGRTLSAGAVNNVVATFPGTANSRAVMLVAHYDSVPEGPGAADDGAGLAVILEAIRALRAGGTTKNDLIVLFSDGEEARGLLGAQAFAAAHPELKDRVGLMLNLEARGSSGPALMFETSEDNGALIREFAAAAPYPMATSLMAAIYKLLPNDTDFTPLKAAGIEGFNFAFLETYETYHTRSDTIENLDPRSVQHLGANVLGVVRHFGNLALPLRKQQDAVYFNWFGSRALVYPAWLAWFVALIAPVLFLLGCVYWASRLQLNFSSAAAGFAIFFLHILLMAGGSCGAFALAKLIAGEFLEGDTVSNQLLFAGIIGLGLTVTLLSQRLLGRKLGLTNLAAGQLVALSLITVALCWFLVGGSYVLQWPLVFAMTGLLVAFHFSEPKRAICQFVFLIPALLILVPLAYMFFAALTFTYSALLAAAFLFTVLLAAAPALFDRLLGRFRLSLVSLLLLSVSAMGAGIQLSARNAAHPRRDTLVYSVNADENKAKWISYDVAADAWTSRVFGTAPAKQSVPSFTVGLERPVLAGDATMIPVSAPVVTKQSNPTGPEQTVTLHIASTRGARSIIVRLPGDLPLTSAGWNQDLRPMRANADSSSPWTFRFYNAPPEGVTLELRFAGRTGVRGWVADSTPGLPSVAPFSPRPPDAVPGYGSDVTLVTKALEL